MSSLDQLRQRTIVVADTGDIDSIAVHRPQDATTNPSLLWKAARMPQYRELVDGAIQSGFASGSADVDTVDDVIDNLAVTFGCRILEIIPGRVSTEVDARLSFDEDATVDRAHKLIGLYSDAGVSRNRILIKIAATWEGIRAAERLENDGIHCNLTLLFGFGQAVACAEAGVTLISPFVGRIYDWYKADRGVDDIAATEDPGVASVTRIFNYFKKHGFHTEVMGASFRRKEQIISLCGCDLLTISPALLSELAAADEEVPVRLDDSAARKMEIPATEMNESIFRWMLNEDAMATEKLADGIRGFTSDLDLLRSWLADQLKTSAATV
ncbi:MAG: transaldolase [Fuerstiella sp.]|nr:transaldolase [Fuerstiella sp.]